jgi:hypothetical protein
VIAAVAQGALVAPTFHSSTLLRVTYLAIGGVGIVAYAYRELFARFVIPAHDYTVSEVRRPNDVTPQRYEIATRVLMSRFRQSATVTYFHRSRTENDHLWDQV